MSRFQSMARLFCAKEENSMPGKSGQNRIDTCVECNKEGPIATSSGLCFTCYRRYRRSLNRDDRHGGDRTKEEAKILKSYTQVIEGLGKLGAGRELVAHIKDLIHPLLCLGGENVDPEIDPVEEHEQNVDSVHAPEADAQFVGAGM